MCGGGASGKELRFKGWVGREWGSGRDTCRWGIGDGVSWKEVGRDDERKKGGERSLKVWGLGDGDEEEGRKKTRGEVKGGKVGVEGGKRKGDDREGVKE